MRVIYLFEWLPIVALPFAVAFLTEGFTHGLDFEIWLIIGAATAINLAWIYFGRWVRRSADFRKSYPGFRMKNDG